MIPIAATAPTTIYNHAARVAISTNWPDGPIGFAPPVGGLYEAFGSDGTGAGQLRTKGTLAAPASTSKSSSSLSGVPSQYAYRNVGTVIKNPVDGSLLGGTHVEEHDPSDYGSFISSVGLSRSTDGGATWTWLGLIFGHAISVGPGIVLDSGPAVIVQMGKYIYCWGNDDTGNQTASTPVIAARSLASDVFSAAASGTVSAWHKWISGSGWTANALTEMGSPLPGCFPLSFFDVVLHSATGTLVASSMTNGLQLTIYFSRDGIHWTEQAQVAPTQQSWVFYPTLVFANQTGYRTGSGPLVNYYIDNDTNIWTNTNLKSVTISLKTGSRRTGLNSFRGGPASAVVR